MLKVKLLIGNNRLSGFEISGHADYDEYGKDIVCAAVSSAALMTANTITEVIKVQADAVADEGNMKFLLKEENAEAVNVLEGFKLHITELSEQYPKNIKIIYGGVQHA